eukprot:CAMPEP_0201541654 /NCGR_PEP_ID=MMETSP0161_2-20130828/71590_1 /ASSEMBLY_ACC=CAM_ASM_000251 /TAXON_ID=180227 /ORGANISM="Neoparamoeba aestuarina, Strain SoJaBio B1-5/56/2" /LENGTH=330 /DNA_ID=CAMNT_0047949203 /DNA_START=37 /DNA_END=1029 /DNA_ORIENTATION=-
MSVPKPPRRPKTAYFLFTADARPQAKQEHPTYTFGELGKVLGDQWAKLPEPEKTEYKEKATKAMEKYKREISEWKAQYPQEAQKLNEDRKRKRDSKAEKKKKKSKKQKKDPNAPKRAMSAFMFYSRDHRARIQEERGFGEGGGFGGFRRNWQYELNRIEQIENNLDWQKQVVIAQMKIEKLEQENKRVEWEANQMKIKIQKVESEMKNQILLTQVKVSKLEAQLEKLNRPASSAHFAPKRAMSAFMFYSRDHRARIQEENQGVTFGEIGRILGAKWKELPDEEREKYIKKANEDRERYHRESENYKKTTKQPEEDSSSNSEEDDEEESEE